jgi:V/A-type H+/Na+-transporting ATPase subunit E
VVQLITIEEKLKLFTKIVYDKVERENQTVVNEFDREFGNLINKRKKEYQAEADKILKESQREAEREKTRILSKAKIEEKKVLRNMEKKIFDEVINELLEHGKKHRRTGEYEESFIKDVTAVSTQVLTDEIEFYCNEEDLQKYRDILKNLFKNKNVIFITDEELVGGFIITEPSQGLRYDMSILGKIMASRETIGNMLFKSLQ